MTWSETDREKALLWAEEDRRKCRTCGTREWEWERYEADLWKCEKCAEMDYKRDDIRDGDRAGWRPVMFAVNGDS